MIDRSKYSEYKLEQTRISGNIDTEFDFFTDDAADDAVDIITDEFISDVKLSGDFHDAMLMSEVQIAVRSAELEPTLIPNYQTLEVMLVERGLTYNAIRVQTNIDDFIYDELDFIDDRSYEYSNVIRFESGYKPAFPFVRDPGDHIRNLNSTSGRFYREIVFQKQTLKEKLREQFEGKFITLRYDINGGQRDYRFWSQLKILIYGVWRTIGYSYTDDETGEETIWASWDILDYYNVINGFGADYDKGRRYVQSDSTVAELIKAGGITNLLDDGKGSPVWNDFNHFDIEDGSTERMDTARYQRYIDTTNNEVFNLEYMQPYEPAGSELYYDEYGGWEEIQY